MTVGDEKEANSVGYICSDMLLIFYGFIINLPWV